MPEPPKVDLSFHSFASEFDHAAGWYEGVASVLWLTGADRLAFLERMSTARLTDLRPGSGRATAVLDDVGRVVDVVACHHDADGTALLTSSVEAAPVVREHLRRYVLRDDVRITDATDQVQVFRLIGSPRVDGDDDRLLEIVQTLIDPIDLLLPSDPGGWAIVGEGPDTHWIMRAVRPGGFSGHHEVRGRPGPGGIDLVVPRGDSATALRRRLADAELVRGTADRYATARILAGLPAFGAELDGRANPLELALKSLVDFEKGCYIGQEVVARLDTYDKVQRHLCRFIGAGAVTAGAAVTPDGTPPTPRSGRVTTSVQRDGMSVGLALIPARDLANASTDRTAETAESTVSLTAHLDEGALPISLTPVTDG